MDARKLKDRALEEMSKRKFDKAAETYAKLIELEPQDLHMRQRRGDALRAAGRKDDAVEIYAELAQTYARDGQLLKAIAVNKVVLEIDPGHTATQSRLAALYSRRTAVKSNPTIAIAMPLTNVIAEGPDEDAAPAEDVMADFLSTPATSDSELSAFLSAGEEAEAPQPEEAPGLEPDLELGLELGLELVREASPPVELPPEPHPEPRAAPPAAEETSFADLNDDRPAPRAPSRVPAEPARPQVTSAPLPPAALASAPAAPVAENAPILDFAIDVEGDEPLFADEVTFESGLDLQALDPATMETLSKLPESPLFESLDADAFMDLLRRCERRTFAAGEALIQQGDPARSFFVLNQGELKVVQTAEGQAPVQLALLHSGDFFGELALVSGGPRGASVIAVTDGEALEFSGQVLRDLTNDHAEAAAALNRFTRARLLQNTMATSPLFRPFDRAQRKLLIAKFVIRDVEPDGAVLVEGQPCDGLYVVMLGRFRVERGGLPVALLTAGDIFGEMSLLTRSAATATVLAEGPGRLLRLPRKVFDELILTHPQVLEYVSTLADERQHHNDDLTGGKLASDRDGLILM